MALAPQVGNEHRLAFEHGTGAASLGVVTAAAWPPADALERAARENGFVACMSCGPVDGRIPDHADSVPVPTSAESLRLPKHIHPALRSPGAKEVHHGWHREVALRCLYPIISGRFDRFPGSQIDVGHIGAGLPFRYWRAGA